MNRFQIVLELLHKIYPEKSSSNGTADLLKPLTEADGAAHYHFEKRIESYIDSIKPLPYFSVLLGTCRDGLPLLIDLANSDLSACLIQAPAKDARNDLLKLMLRSAVQLNPPEIIQYVIITPHIRDYEFESGFPHCLDVLHPGQREAGELVMELSALIEQRNTGRQRGPAVIFVIEELERFINLMDEEILSNFKWILREGPGARVWPIATSNGPARLADKKVTSFFDTRIESSEHLLAGVNHAEGGYASNAGHFQVSFSGEIYDFSLPAR